MFCPKCHTELQENDIICTRCGTEIQAKDKKSIGSFSSSRTFSRMNQKNIMNTHEDQYEYSKDYSEVVQDNNESHEEQYEYNKKYSSIRKDNNDPHDTQYEYNKKYSSIRKDNNDPHDTQYEYNKKHSSIRKDNNDPHEDQYRYSEEYSMANTDYISSDENYVDAYIGTSCKQLKEDNFSIWALLFGPFYLLYRKMYSQAIVSIVVYIITTAYLQNSYSIFVQLFINIILGKSFKTMYLKHVYQRIASIKNANPDKSSTELLELCKKAGGTLKESTIAAIIFAYIMLLCCYNFAITIKEEITPSNEMDNLIYNLPPSTKQYSDTETYKSYGDGYCHITIQVNRYERYQSEREYLNAINNYIDNKSIIKQETYNSYTWYSQEVIENYEESYNINAILYNNKIYDITFHEQEMNACDSTKEFIMSSTRFH